MSKQTTQRKLERLLGKNAILPVSEELLRGEGVMQLEFSNYKQMAQVRSLLIHNGLAAEQKDSGAAGPFKIDVYLDAEAEQQAYGQKSKVA